jgi:Family of unknown function (DUF6152)
MLSAIRSTALLATLLVAAPGYAHHSGAIFDPSRRVTLTGTVREFQWTNPHCWIQVIVPGSAGEEEWSVEMGAPLQLYQGGWKPGTLKPGDEITVVVHPLRDGMRGGLFVAATRKDGTVLWKEP